MPPGSRVPGVWRLLPVSLVVVIVVIHSSKDLVGFREPGGDMEAL